MSAKKKTAKKTTPRTPLKDGDYVKVLTDSDADMPKGSYGRVTDSNGSRYRVDHLTNGNDCGYFTRTELQKVTKAELPSVNFILQYMLDEDPIEFFETIDQVKKRIAYLVHEEEDLQLDSFVVYQVSKVSEIKVEKTVNIEGL